MRSVFLLRSFGGHGGVVGTVYVGLRAMLRNWSRGIPADSRVRGDIIDYHSVGADRRVVPNLDAPNDLGSRCDIDIVADDSGSGFLAATHLSEGNIVRKVAVIPNDRAPRHEDAAEVADIETATDARIPRNIDTETDGVVVQQEHDELSHTEAAPPPRTGPRVEPQKDGITETGRKEEMIPKSAASSAASMPPQIRRDESPASLPGHEPGTLKS